MKLVCRILLHLAWALSLLLAAWAVLFYVTMIDEINDEMDDALEARAEVILTRVLAGRELPAPASEGNNAYFLNEVSAEYAAAQPRERYSDEEIFLPEPGRRGSRHACCARCSTTATGRWYELTVMTPTIEKEDLREAILGWIVSLYLFLLGMILLVTVVVLYRTMPAPLRPARWLDGYTVGAQESAAGRRNLRHGVPAPERRRTPLCRARRGDLRTAEAVHRQRLARDADPAGGLPQPARNVGR